MGKGCWKLEDLFEFTGQTAIILMVTAGVTGISGAKIRRVIKGPWVFRLHKWAGVGSLAFGIIHAMIH